MIQAKKVIVCSSTAETGGPELLHQLVDRLRRNGINAFICYHGIQDAKKPARFMMYDAPISAIEDEVGTYLLVPENETGFLRSVKKARAGVWWLSVDNYYGYKYQSVFRDMRVRFRSLMSTRLPLYRIRGFDHFTQSAYAKNFLRKKRIESTMLGDFLRPEFLALDCSGGTKKNIIVYNPNKGAKQFAAVRRAYPDYEFVPVENMQPHEVATLLSEAKVFADFGHHPGKDRPPREAAMAGCCVITGRRGSANFHEDVAIPEKYKLGNHYLQEFGELVDGIFNHFEDKQRDFDLYRERIHAEPALFIRQVEQIFGSG